MVNNYKIKIPEICKAGFLTKDNTQTGLLSYIIRKDGNVFSSQKSFENWRDTNIPTIEFANEPHNRFFIAKSIRRNNYFSGNIEKLRIYDEKNNCEFEIPYNIFVDLILEYCDSVKKQLIGEFVYAWYESTIFILPTNSDLYLQYLNLKNEKDNKISSKEIKPGFYYKNHKGQNLLYIGKCNYTNSIYNNFVKKHIFYNQENELVVEKDFKNILSVVSQCDAMEYTNLLDKYQKSFFNSKPKEVHLTKIENFAPEKNKYFLVVEKNSEEIYYDIYQSNMYNKFYSWGSFFPKTMVWRINVRWDIKMPIGKDVYTAKIENENGGFIDLNYYLRNKF